MATASVLSPHKRRIFTSVFPTQARTTPTPEVSPYIGAPPSPIVSQSNESISIADQIAQRSVAWSLVTRWLSVSTSLQAPRPAPPGLDDALVTLIQAGVVVQGQSYRDLLGWFVDDARAYFDARVKPALDKLWQPDIKCSNAHKTLTATLEILEKFQGQSLGPIDSWLSNHHDVSRHADHTATMLIDAITSFRVAALDRIHTIVLHCLPSHQLLSGLTFLLHQTLSILSGTEASSQKSSAASADFLSRLTLVGLGQDLGQKALAHAVKAAITTYIDSFEMRVDWIGKRSVATILRTWVEQHLQPVIIKCLHLLTGDPSLTLSLSERNQWQVMALNSLGRLRIKYLLRYVQSWDQSLGAILDIKEYVRTPEAKNHLAASFAHQMQSKILHAGVKTSELLSIYINIIHVFKTLDNRGVLLEKVAQPLRAFLRQRDDTVKVIAASFLADIDVKGDVVDGAEDVCADIALEVIRSEEEDTRAAEKALDWDDMEWTPDPIDAGVDFKKSKGNDIISYIITLFEQDDFIKEVQTILGERLLRSEDADLEKETRLVELFKSRLGSDKLQTCEVMLRDMQDSARIMTSMRKWDAQLPTVQEIYEAIPEHGIPFRQIAELFYQRYHMPTSTELWNRFNKLLHCAARQSRMNKWFYPATNGPSPPPQFYAQILSSFFWPALREDDFAVPAPIAELKSEYERDFERMKNQRRLHWLSGLGRATVELELEDRTLRFENVHTWQASVVYAFQTPPPKTQDIDQDMTDDDVDMPAVSLTIDHLVAELKMDELLVRNAIAFWVSQRVLIATTDDETTYRVLETLPSDEESGAASPSKHPPAAAVPAISAVKSQNAILMDNKDMYQVFIVGMLTNGGNMDPARIEMMMKMVMPGGFAFGVEEVRWLLQDLVQQERVEEVSGAGVYGIRK